MFSALESIMSSHPHAVRQLGSGVMDLCFVAAGRLDAIYAGVAGEGWKPWDYCAGSLLITEAGGTIKTLGNLPFYVEADSVAAAGTEELLDHVITTVGQFKVEV